MIIKLFTFANAVLTVSNTYFLVPFYMYCYGQLIHYSTTYLPEEGEMPKRRTDVVTTRHKDDHKNTSKTSTRKSGKEKITTMYVKTYTFAQLKTLSKKYQEIRTISEQFWAEIARKLRTAQPEPKVTGSYKKKLVHAFFFIRTNL